MLIYTRLRLLCISETLQPLKGCVWPCLRQDIYTCSIFTYRVRGHSCEKYSLSASTEHPGKEKAKERDREEREKKKFKEREKEKKKHKAVNDIQRENGEVKQPIKGWWKHKE